MTPFSSSNCLVSSAKTVRHRTVLKQYDDVIIDPLSDYDVIV